MTAKRYRVLDPHAKKIGGVPVNAGRTVTLTDAQAKYPLDQRQIVLAAETVTFVLPAAVGKTEQMTEVAGAGVALTGAGGEGVRGARGRKR